MIEYFDLDKLWINPKIKMEIRSKNNWSKLRVKLDKKTGKHYFDILFGFNERKDWHTHIGINLDGKRRFVEYRDQVATIRRTDESEKYGRIFDKEVTVDSSKKPKVNLIFKPCLNGVTGEVTVVEFKIEDLV